MRYGTSYAQACPRGQPLAVTCAQMCGCFAKSEASSPSFSKMCRKLRLDFSSGFACPTQNERRKEKREKKSVNGDNNLL